jgi:hypothetical protein
MANSTRRRATATAESFAHLAGLGRGAIAARAEDETNEEKKDREDKAQAERDEECAKKEAAGEDTGEDDDEKDARKARQKARGASAADESDDDGDDDSDREEMRGEAASIRRRERARCAAIFSTQAAGRNPVLAANLAFGSDLTRSAAIRILRDSPAAHAGATHRPDRAAGNPALGSGGGRANGPVNEQAMWDQALAKAGVKLPARA